mmetsp:Transcript_12817/g.46878  ORF Transcript_12817/g.46878 Transcript_12817/m.46878 type:complete len:203 (-) Transcript_12817:107-715(-)
MLDANNRVAWYTAPGDHFSGLVTYSTSSQLAKCGSILKAFGTFPDLYRDNKAPTPWYTSIALSSKPDSRWIFSSSVSSVAPAGTILSCFSLIFSMMRSAKVLCDCSGRLPMNMLRTRSSSAVISSASPRSISSLKCRSSLKSLALSSKPKSSSSSLSSSAMSFCASAGVSPKPSPAASSASTSRCWARASCKISCDCLPDTL